MKKKTTIHDIAEYLNITGSTVSRALNDHPKISKATKKAVQKAVIKLNYQPNNIAAALRSGKSNIIGIIVPTADRSFFSSVVYGIEEIANTAGYNVMICQTHDSHENEVNKVQALLNAGVDGIIASHAKECTNFDHFKKIIANNIPLILFDRSINDLGVSQVVIDDFLGASMATEHLIKQGCKRIAHFTSVQSISIYNDRLRGYRESLRVAGIEYDEKLVKHSNLQLEDGIRCMKELLTTGEKPDAVFSSSALGAIGAMQVLKESGLRVPEDVAIVAFSNEVYMAFTGPTLSTVEQHSKRMGNIAAEIFLKEITDKKVPFYPQKIVINPELIIRESSLRKK
ncbi:LacI family DNA-binding transcriptional regulator [Algoriphagus sp. D3-2-R+10]|uniref:LacI family DNA-binding transcriptional regulator n=1 Tax=Algoriphagus aurantiacus TaxID=3103948 RepID=UPI002B3FD5C0|nr:LacI family DNA-binding transcriptional regulator [Algoriphagus sp. D3-2-R+10]MEB2774691.1 LacI family DNA-binding transcriptional regulator [Algoriphagus sp. D3-2-R+10]